MTKSIVAIFAHPDDEILGCGGSLALHKTLGDSVHVLLLSKGLKSRSKNKMLFKNFKTQIQNANKVLGVESIKILDYPDNTFDSVKFINIVKSIEDFVDVKKPNIIYTHHVGDLNIDHEITHKAVLTATRPIGDSQLKKILSCEVNSSTEWSFNSKGHFSTNYFINIQKTIEKKRKALLEYKNEIRHFPHPRSVEGVEVLAKYRGMQSGLTYAESFIISRCIEK